MENDSEPVKKGKGHPPKDHQWPPGVSGNPFGRPLGSRNKKKAIPGLTPSEQIALEEAARKVGTSNGEMEAIRAVHRAQLKAAADGGSNAQRDYINRTAKLEQKAWDQRQALLQSLEEYKRQYEYDQLTLDDKQMGRLEQTLLPHPDDIEIDFARGTYSIKGPATTQERKIWNEGMVAHARMRDMVFECRRDVLADPSRPGAHLTLIDCTDRFMRNNDKLPERYRLKRLPIWKEGKNLAMPEVH
ncbi:MAG TPA: DUF5681 domain-containing protein [Sphingomicrobium sp.]|nr:DUF5681 domain-containing protein [Sphingomicrobium sp.]